MKLGVVMCLQSIGVKFKVVVTDKDVLVDDDVDDLVQLLQLTPALSNSTASWIKIVMNGSHTRHDISHTAVIVKLTFE